MFEALFNWIAGSFLGNKPDDASLIINIGGMLQKFVPMVWDFWQGVFNNFNK